MKRYAKTFTPDFWDTLYIIVWICSLVFCTIVAAVPVVNQVVLGIAGSLDAELRPLMGTLLMFPFTLLTLPILLSIFYNYSQYMYYGNDYYGSMAEEFQSRNTHTYLRHLEASIVEE